MEYLESTIKAASWLKGLIRLSLTELQGLQETRAPVHHSRFTGLKVLISITQAQIDEGNSSIMQTWIIS